MTQNQAIEQIGAPIIEAFSDSWKNAWDDIRGQFNHPDHSNRIRSSLLQEHAAIHARQMLPLVGVNYMRDQTQHMFIMPDKACIIYKKLSEGRRASRNDTDRADRQFQSLLLEDLPTLVVGMLPAYNWTSFVGIYLLRPKENGIGNSWVLDITNGIFAVDSDQSTIVPIMEETEFDETTTKPKQKFKPKYDPNIGEGEEEAGSGGNIGE
jgi:hypothetical protein